ncbi:hypothetical protein [Nocardia sp. NPDC055049]
MKAARGFAVNIYSGSGSPLTYRWSRRGDILVDAGLGMTYTGTISSDGATPSPSEVARSRRWWM